MLDVPKPSESISNGTMRQYLEQWRPSLNVLGWTGQGSFRIWGSQMIEWLVRSSMVARLHLMHDEEKELVDFLKSSSKIGYPKWRDDIIGIVRRTLEKKMLKILRERVDGHDLWNAFPTQRGSTSCKCSHSRKHRRILCSSLEEFRLTWLSCLKWMNQECRWTTNPLPWRVQKRFIVVHLVKSPF